MEERLIYFLRKETQGDSVWYICHEKSYKTKFAAQPNQPRMKTAAVVSKILSETHIQLYVISSQYHTFRYHT